MHHLSISVVIPTYNRAHLVGRALASALKETTADDEIIVVDDGSTDRTEAVVKEFREVRIRYIRQSNSGAGAARNRGASEAEKDLVAFLDSDDEWLPGGKVVQRRLMSAREDVLFCFTDFVRITAGVRENHSIQNWHTDPRTWSEIMGPPVMYSTMASLPPGLPDVCVHVGNIYHDEMTANYVLTSTVVIRREQAGDAIHFTEGIPTYEDWECFGRLAQRGPAAYLDLETAVQFGHQGPRLTDADLLTCSDARLAVLDRVWGSDPAFLAQHGDEYASLVQQQRTNKVRGLLSQGRVREARSELRTLAPVPLEYKVLSHLPGAVVAGIVLLRRAVNDWVA